MRARPTQYDTAWSAKPTSIAAARHECYSRRLPALCEPSPRTCTLHVGQSPPSRVRDCRCAMDRLHKVDQMQRRAPLAELRTAAAQSVLTSSQLLQIQLQPRATSMRRRYPHLDLPPLRAAPLQPGRTEMTRIRSQLVLARVQAVGTAQPTSLPSPTAWMIANPAGLVAGSDLCEQNADAKLCQWLLGGPCLIRVPSQWSPDQNQSLCLSQK